MSVETHTQITEEIAAVVPPVWHLYEGCRPHPAGTRALCGHAKRSTSSSAAPSDRDVCVVCVELAVAAGLVIG